MCNIRDLMNHNAAAGRLIRIDKDMVLGARCNHRLRGTHSTLTVIYIDKYLKKKQFVCLSL